LFCFGTFIFHHSGRVAGIKMDMNRRTGLLSKAMATGCSINSMK